MATLVAAVQSGRRIGSVRRISCSLPDDTVEVTEATHQAAAHRRAIINPSGRRAQGRVVHHRDPEDPPRSATISRCWNLKPRPAAYRQPSGRAATPGSERRSLRDCAWMKADHSLIKARPPSNSTAWDARTCRVANCQPLPPAADRQGLRSPAGDPLAERASAGSAYGDRAGSSSSLRAPPLTVGLLRRHGRQDTRLGSNEPSWKTRSPCATGYRRGVSASEATMMPSRRATAWPIVWLSASHSGYWLASSSVFSSTTIGLGTAVGMPLGAALGAVPFSSCVGKSGDT